MASADLIAKAVDKFVEDMRLQLFANRAQSLHRLQAAFEQVDFSGTGEVDRDNFNDCMNFVGLFPSTMQIKTLFRHFDPHSKRETIAYADFMNLFLKPLSSRRKAIVDKAWNSLAAGDQSVSLDTMVAIFNAKGHPYVRMAVESEDSVVQNFRDSFAGSIVTYEDFLTYYVHVSAAAPRDTYFVELLEACWNVKEVVTNVDEKRMRSLAELLREKVRQKMRPCESGAITCKRCFMFHDADDADKLNREEFVEACAHFGLQLTAKDVADFFFVYGQSGNISINEFSRDIHNGEFEKRVASAV